MDLSAQLAVSVGLVLAVLTVGILLHLRSQRAAARCIEQLVHALVDSGSIGRQNAYDSLTSGHYSTLGPAQREHAAMIDSAPYSSVPRSMVRSSRGSITPEQRTEMVASILGRVGMTALEMAESAGLTVSPLPLPPGVPVLVRGGAILYPADSHDPEEAILLGVATYLIERSGCAGTADDVRELVGDLSGHRAHQSGEMPAVRV